MFCKYRENRREITKKLYNLFEDKFDFISYIFNEFKLEPLTSNGGWFTDVQKNIEGIGQDHLFDISHMYGSQGRLTGLYILLERMGLFYMK